MFPDEFILKIPKTDLHCHLDGSIRLQTMIDLAIEQNITLPAYTVEGLKTLVFKESYNNLEEYLECFSYSGKILTNVDALFRVAYEFAVDQYSIGVRYFEVRFAPQLNAVPGKMSVEEVLVAVNNGLKKGTTEFNDTDEVINGYAPPYSYGIICCAMRNFDPSYGPYFRQFGDFHPHETHKRIAGLLSMALVSTCHHLKCENHLPIVAIDIVLNLITKL